MNRNRIKIFFFFFIAIIVSSTVCISSKKPPKGIRRQGAWVGLNEPVILANENLPSFIGLIRKNNLTIYRQMDSVPKFVDTFYIILGSYFLHDMANPGENWQASDAVVDRPLPHYRLDWFGIGNGIAALVYESGGWGTATHIALFAFDKRKRVTDFWTEAGLWPLQNQRTLLHVLDSEKNIIQTGGDVRF